VAIQLMGSRVVLSFTVSQSGRQAGRQAGRAVPQAVSHRFPTAVVRFEPRSCHVGTVVDSAAPGRFLLEYYGFPCHSFTPLITSQLSSSMNQGCYNAPINGYSNSALGYTPAPYINTK
jgi:hypothetical protein